jgi:diguanylate cyclase (GGDEF)-like protein
MAEYGENLIANNTPFSFFIVDVDNFKNVNDNYGHLLGDVVLIKTAEYICDKVGDKGVVGRYGGDEFIIIFEGLQEYSDVWSIGHYINSDINTLRFDGAPELGITITMGVSRFPVNASAYEDIMKYADKALYRGKTKGRNCFIIYLEEKHKNITMRSDKGKKYSSMYLCSRVFYYLTLTDDLKTNIQLMFRWLVGFYMFDHISIETNDKMNFEMVHLLARTKHFNHISCDQMDEMANGQGLVNIGRVLAFEENTGGKLIESLKDQRVSSELCHKISAYGKDYGYIRVDMTSSARMWQADEMDIIVIAANALGMILYYQNKTLNDFEIVPPEIVQTDNN